MTKRSPHNVRAQYAKVERKNRERLAAPQPREVVVYFRRRFLRRQKIRSFSNARYGIQPGFLTVVQDAEAGMIQQVFDWADVEKVVAFPRAMLNPRDTVPPPPPPEGPPNRIVKEYGSVREKE